LAQRCDFCGKGKMTGHTVSHANNLSNRVWNPNLQKVRALIEGRVKSVYACTRCLRSNKVTKAARGRRYVAVA
jgi:large subunit ribosomal protein L28